MNDTSIQTPEFNEPSRRETNVVICICGEKVDNRNGKDIGTIWSQGVMLAKDWEKSVSLRVIKTCALHMGLL